MRSATVRLLGVLLAMVVVVAAGAARADDAPAGTLDRIRQTQTIRIAYRQDAAPFSYADSAGVPAGLIVDLCKAVAEHLSQQLALPSLRVAYVLVTASDRFDAIEQHKADLLCEPTSATLSRRKLVDFSIATFIDGAGLMVRESGPHNLQGLAGQKIGVLAGTTTEQELRASLADAGITAEIIVAKTHPDGLAMLDDGRISAYFADRSILVTLITESKDPGKLALADEYLTLEPYALALPHGDEDFRLEVDEALSHIYRGGELRPMFERAFGNDVKLAPIVQALYLVSALRD